MKITVRKRPELEPARQLKVRAKDEETGYVQELNFKNTNHSLERSSSRGISALHLETALTYGESVYKQGLIFCILGKNRIPEKMAKMRDKIMNTVVVLDGTSENILTCYRSKDPFKSIRKKSKRLSTYKNAA